VDLNLKIQLAMTPLFPLGYIDQGWYLIIIFFIGLFFGLVLEQSGFSSSRKLAGVFYGYDFVVLKVFFTAGITAMSGLVILGYFGITDLSVLYVNSNFLVSAAAGGVIMGFGFIMGGFCPGTSVTGAVIGKIDAMVFIAGIFLGVFVFGAFDTTFNKLFTGYYFDGEMISNTMGIPKNTMVLIWIVMALVAFGVAAWFEKRSTKGLRPTNHRYPSLRKEVFLALTIGVIILFLPPLKGKSLFEQDATRLTDSQLREEQTISSDEFAFLLIRDPGQLQIIDVRDPEMFATFHLPGSENIPLELITHRTFSEVFRDQGKRTVLISNGGTEAVKAQVLLARMGVSHVVVLQGGLNRMISDIFYDNDLPEGANGQDVIGQYRFRQRASEYFLGRDGQSRPLPSRPATSTQPTRHPAVQATGGC
jgi:rhodanese-related sulfurtransferase